MRAWRTVLTAILLAGCAIAPVPLPDDAAAIREAAERATRPERRASIHLAAYAEDARRHGEPGVARDRAEQALSLDPRNPYAYLVLARSLADEGEPAAALKMAREAEERFKAEEPGSVWEERAARLREALEGEPSPSSGAPGLRVIGTLR